MQIRSTGKASSLRSRIARFEHLEARHFLSLSANLLVNPGAESGSMYPWTSETSGLQPPIARSIISDGDFRITEGSAWFKSFYYGYPNGCVSGGSASLQQQVYVSNFNFASGGVVVFGGDLIGGALRVPPDADHTTAFFVYFYNLSGTLIGYDAEFVRRDFHGPYQDLDVRASKIIPPGTAMIEFRAQLYASFCGHDLNMSYFALDDLYLAVDPKPFDIAVTSAAMSPEGDSFTVGWTVTGNAPTSTSSIDVYWAAGPSTDDILAAPHYSISTGVATGTFSTEVLISQLSPRPNGASHLLFVADSSKQVFETNEDNNLRSVALPPEIVIVVTHGAFSSSSSFQELGDILEQTLGNSATSYVANWDSTTGFKGALLSLISSQILPPSLQPISNLSLTSFLSKSRQLAENAAQEIVVDIVGNSQYLADPGLRQRIHLVGHSRGAAVNARVSELLEDEKHGYTVTEYTSLDGFSTDWLPPAGLLGDLDIRHVAAAEVRDNVQVDVSLDAVLADLIVSLGFSRTPSNIELELMRTFFRDWRAPTRAAYDFNDKILRKINGEPSTHFNIWRLYGEFLNNPDDFVVIGGGAGDSNMATGNGVLSADDEFSNFTDGSFEQIGQLAAQIHGTDFSGDSAVVDTWLDLLDTNQEVLNSLWLTQGIVDLQNTDGNYSAELRQNGASIGQFLHLPNGGSRLEFHIDPRNSSVDDTLSVMLGDTLVTTIALSQDDARNLSVPLSSFAGEHGILRVRLNSPANQAVVLIDNLRIEEGLPGDYDNDRDVDGQDYSLWQSTFGLTSSNLPPDGNLNTIVDAADYVIWRKHQGQTTVPPTIAGDYDRSGTVDGADYDIWRYTFGAVGQGHHADGNNNANIDAADYVVWRKSLDGQIVTSLNVGQPSFIPTNGLSISPDAVSPFISVSAFEIALFSNRSTVQPVASQTHVGTQLRIERIASEPFSTPHHSTEESSALKQFYDAAQHTSGNVRNYEFDVASLTLAELWSDKDQQRGRQFVANPTQERTRVSMLVGVDCAFDDLDSWITVRRFAYRSRTS